MNLDDMLDIESAQCDLEQREEQKRHDLLSGDLADELHESDCRQLLRDLLAVLYSDQGSVSQVWDARRRIERLADMLTEQKVT